MDLEQWNSIENELDQEENQTPNLFGAFEEEEGLDFQNFYAYNSSRNSPLLNLNWDPKFEHDHSGYCKGPVSVEEPSQMQKDWSVHDILMQSKTPDKESSEGLSHLLSKEMEYLEQKTDSDAAVAEGVVPGESFSKNACQSPSIACEHDLTTLPETEEALSSTEPIVIKVTREAQFELFCDYSERVDADLAEGLFELEDKGYCTCQKTKCLKMYCPCFRKGIVCGTLCSCVECKNKKENKEEVAELRAKKLSLGKSYVVNTVDEVCCSCKGSFCEKAYCPCFKFKKGCGPSCKCFNCKNKYGVKKKDKN